jgi:hypothetical protein
LHPFVKVCGFCPITKVHSINQLQFDCGPPSISGFLPVNEEAKRLHHIERSDASQLQEL